MYCDCKTYDIADRAVFLEYRGYRNIFVMPEGYSGWVKRGYPLDSNRALMCQVSELPLLFILLLAPTPLFAHAYLVKSVPAQRAVLFHAPAKIQLWFNERLEPRYSSLTLSDGRRQDRRNRQSRSQR